MSSRIPHNGANSTIMIDNSDKVSCLHETLWHNILFFLPLKDAITTSSVSKAMLKAWTSLPTLEFHFHHKNGKDLEKFVRSITHSLSILKQHRAFINTFSLKVDMESENLDDLNLISDQFDEWVGLVVRNYVKEIEITFSNSYVYYTLPKALFTSKTLVKLYLEHCKFPFYIPFGLVDDGFNSLQDLCLVNVLATEKQVHDLVNFSRRFLEKLIIKNCPFVQVFMLNGFEKLGYLEIHDMTLFKAQGCLELHTLVMHKIWKVEFLNCPNITTLRCFTPWHPHHDAYKCIEALIQNLPLFVTLELLLSQNLKLKIQNHHLRTLILVEGERWDKEALQVLEVEVETPSLRRVYFDGFCVPFVSGVVNNGYDVNNNNNGNEEEVQLHHFGDPSGGLDGVHLHQLGKFSEHLIHPCLEIYLHELFTEKFLSLEELRENYSVVQFSKNVRKLVLECIPSNSSHYTSFLNCLFWSCHPNSLVLNMTSEKTLHSPQRNAFIEFLWKELLYREEDYTLTCCIEDALPKCWRHFIADVKCSVYKNIEENDHIDLPTQLPQHSHRVTLVDTKDNTNGVVVVFSFQWLPYPI